MKAGSPRGWPYSVNSSPEPLPTSAWLHTSRLLMPMNPPSTTPSPDTIIEAPAVLEWVGSHLVSGEGGEEISTLDDWLKDNDMSPMSARRLYLVIGELGNPYRLADIGISGMPIIPVRMDGICRTWTDVLDNRELHPGIHHVMLARTSGWWERTQLAFPDKDQSRALTTWLNNGSSTVWQQKRLAEGSIRISPAEDLFTPTPNQLEWDGKQEWVEAPSPQPNGAKINLADIIVPLFTRQGIYDHRGRIARCSHHLQRPFHHDIFRRGSAKAWDQAIDTL